MSGTDAWEGRAAGFNPEFAGAATAAGLTRDGAATALTGVDDGTAAGAEAVEGRATADTADG